MTASGRYSTEGAEYAERLVRLERVWWKRFVPVQAPYRWNLRRLEPGLMLDVGCGTGRNLGHVLPNGVGVDHNKESVSIARERGYDAFTPSDFWASEHATRRTFDSLLLSHVAEHLTFDDSAALMEQYLVLIRPAGKVILITPQEAGFRSDDTHVTFMDFGTLDRIGARVGLRRVASYSFPFPRIAGRIFAHNEFVWVGVRMDADAR